ncbi:MAG: hypothetical protein HC921_19290 [Synechococcaceae cyanobacterium SM2_3_1]|nr:hypothetical protein [Synechococcaceae cyanobacterium SM2_3_1]
MLFLQGDRLVYAGEQVQFSFPREAIRRFEVSAGKWIGQISIIQVDTAGGKSFYLENLEVGLVNQIKPELIRIKQKWDARVTDDSVATPAALELPPLQIGEVTGTSIREMHQPKAIFKFFWSTILAIVVVLSLLFQLLFTSFGYVLGISFLSLFAIMLPHGFKQQAAS